MITNKRELAPPSPEVQYLPAVFRRIESGEIRIPAFQRRFVWTEAQILELLESVYKGYPIGSVLFWKVSERKLEIERDESLPFPDVEEKYPISFVLDGMQRLTSLYGVFHCKDKLTTSVFNVIFDLRKEKFIHFDPKQSWDAYIHLSALFSPKQLLDTQKDLSKLTDGDILIDRTIKLHSTFQEYLIPTVTITQRDVPEVVEIFERVNSTGTVLGAVDFMRALTWSSEFDLSREISRIQKGFGDRNFFFDAETVVKTLAVVLGKAPTPREMLLLRNYSPIELHKAVDETEQVLGRVIDFLKNSFRILSSEFVPYEGQLLVLAKLFHLDPKPSSSVLSAVIRWFWSVGLSEGFRGKPDYFVVSAINDTQRLLTGDRSALNHRLDLNPQDLMERRFIKGKALSLAIASMFAARGVRSLLTGEVLDPEIFMLEFSSENFQALYDIASIRKIFGEDLPSAKIFANVIVVTEAERRTLSTITPVTLMEDIFRNFGDEQASVILDSQFFSDDVVEAIQKNELIRFLSTRAVNMYQSASALSSVQEDVT